MNIAKRERRHFYCTLVGLVKALENECTVIDFKHEASVMGRIKKVDGFMNIEMEDVTFFNPRGSEYRFKDFTIPARNIRYVHIPKELSAKDLLEKQFEALSKRDTKKPRPATFKEKRAREYNEDTKRIAYAQN